MKAVIVMYDSLNRHMLEPYGCTWARTPNFKRLAARSLTFDNSYICSMPCMPARRDLHTGRPNFLHRGWGPLEPYDDSMPEILRERGIHTHLATDHQHYWEDGGANYHPRYTTFDLIRGQEGDPWYAQVSLPPEPQREGRRTDRMALQDVLNRNYTSDAKQYPMNVTFDKGLEFLKRNHATDNWMLQIESFDPHEPFFSLDEFREPYRAHFDSYTGQPFEWPEYREVREPVASVEHLRYEYAALVNGCDQQLGRVLDAFDQYNLWEDTMLIVCTDHGFLLGEHDCWAKCWMPFYNEIARTPFFIWSPRHPEYAGERRQALIQPAIDIPVTLLNYFGSTPTAAMTGQDLSACICDDTPVREHAIFGIFGGHVNITDGDYVYMRGPTSVDNQPLYEYTCTPARMRSRYPVEQLSQTESLAPRFDFDKNCPNLKIPTRCFSGNNTDARQRLPTQLFALGRDPHQLHPMAAPEIESRFCAALAQELILCDAPDEQFQRLGLRSPQPVPA
ncbi:sulfatase [Ruficoccus amylovorans]|uniref:Sulfatase n=1 Tax=Ruficoccus amylovorans TaxID=1804625 RepID=A0A842HK39_9BACT|nr:sulfatase [Ruficoccus amylovorans]MBC2595916.1 sulfatase [Ruficoccus amylovorans]